MNGRCGRFYLAAATTCFVVPTVAVSLASCRCQRKSEEHTGDRQQCGLCVLWAPGFERLR